MAVISSLILHGQTAGISLETSSMRVSKVLRGHNSEMRRQQLRQNFFYSSTRCECPTPDLVSFYYMCRTLQSMYSHQMPRLLNPSFHILPNGCSSEISPNPGYFYMQLTDLPASHTRYVPRLANGVGKLTTGSRDESILVVVSFYSRDQLLDVRLPTGHQIS